MRDKVNCSHCFCKKKDKGTMIIIKPCMETAKACDEKRARPVLLFTLEIYKNISLGRCT